MHQDALLTLLSYFSCWIHKEQLTLVSKSNHELGSGIGTELTVIRSHRLPTASHLWMHPNDPNTTLPEGAPIISHNFSAGALFLIDTPPVSEFKLFSHMAVSLHPSSGPKGIKGKHTFSFPGQKTAGLPRNSFLS